MKVLIAEDDVVVRTVLRQLVVQLGDEPIVAADGDEAWALQQAHRCGAVISDWSMPGCDGIELLTRIRHLDAGNGYTYFILLTAHDEPAAVEKALAAGVDDHLSKPVQKAELMARIAVARRIVALHQDVAERNRQLAEANRRMRRDLAAAASAQKALLPSVLPQHPGLKMGWRYQPCEECAGDLIGVQQIDPHRIGMYLFDVSGHGVASALMAVQVARVLMAVMRLVPTPLGVAQALNETFYIPGSLRFVTLAYAVLDLRTWHLSLVSAGHPAPLVLRANGVLESHEIAAHPIGLFPSDTAQFTAWDIDLARGDRLLFVSDGVLEANGTPGYELDQPTEAFGVDRLQTVWKKSIGKPQEEALSAIMDTLAVWRGRGRLEDDITALALERTI